MEDDWKPDKFMLYKFVSDYAVITFTVPGMSDWEEPEFDSAAQSDLESYVTDPKDYYLDDSEEIDNG
jgi:hypothetical protein